MSLQSLKTYSRRGPAHAARSTVRVGLDHPALFDTAEPTPRPARRTLPVPQANVHGRHDVGPHDAVLMVDIETVPDTDLIPSGWPEDRFPKAAWHRIVAISIVEATLERNGRDGTEAYRIRCCRSGGEADWDEGRLLRAFWSLFEGGRYRVVTWNGRSFDMPTLLHRSMRHGFAVPSWFQRGTKWDCYGHRYALAWHTDLMEAVSDFGATARLTLGEAAALVGAPGKLGEHGADVAALVADGQTGRVRDYCETDCINLFIIYLRWAYLTGRTNAEAHDDAVRGLKAYLGKERTRRPHLGRFADAWAGGARTSPYVDRPPRSAPLG